MSHEQYTYTPEERRKYEQYPQGQILQALHDAEKRLVGREKELREHKEDLISSERRRRGAEIDDARSSSENFAALATFFLVVLQVLMMVKAGTLLSAVVGSLLFISLPFIVWGVNNLLSKSENKSSNLKSLILLGVAGLGLVAGLVVPMIYAIPGLFANSNLVSTLSFASVVFAAAISAGSYYAIHYKKKQVALQQKNDSVDKKIADKKGKIDNEIENEIENKASINKIEKEIAREKRDIAALKQELEQRGLAPQQGSPAGSDTSSNSSTNNEPQQSPAARVQILKELIEARKQEEELPAAQGSKGVDYASQPQGSSQQASSVPQGTTSSNPLPQQEISQFFSTAGQGNNKVGHASPFFTNAEYSRALKKEIARRKQAAYGNKGVSYAPLPTSAPSSKIPKSSI